MTGDIKYYMMFKEMEKFDAEAKSEGDSSLRN